MVAIHFEDLNVKSGTVLDGNRVCLVDHCDIYYTYGIPTPVFFFG